MIEFPLQAVRLVKRVEGTVTHTLVDGIDLAVRKGEFLAITGPSGSGKSSLLYLLGLLDAPTEGEVIICGHETSKLSENERADVRLMKCGFVFQFHFLLPEFTALENVMLPMRTADILSANEMDERARMLLGMLGLETQLHKRPNQLSGGQRQRVALARALANKPEIIVADEPTGNLDVASTEQVFGILRDIADNGQTVVVVTHDAALAARADRRIHIVDGKIAETTFGGDSRHAANGHDSESAGHSDSVPVLERPKRPRSDPPVSSETHLSSCSEGRQVNSTATNLGFQQRRESRIVLSILSSLLQREEMMRKSLFGVTVAALTLLTSQPLLAQNDADHQLGNVHFKTSCNDVAQRRFDRGMRYQHSYWYINAKEVFEEVIKADPTCAIAYWGIALTLMDNPHNAIPRPNLAPGLAAITKAKEIGANTERERDYIDALMVMYADYDKLPHAQRMRALRDAQAQVAAKYPDDDEAQIAYAITLNTSADLNDKTYAQQAKGAEILEPMSARLPQHPGVTHYLIHLYDYPATAQKGLDAANRYAKIAPAAPHAQHMPSHIYTRVGYWKESIASNTASVSAAKAEKSVGNYLHAQDYMVYAHLQLAQDQQARAVIDDMIRENDFKVTVAAADYALAASPARYAIDRGDWDGASQLSVRPSGLNFAMAISHFARSLGAARSGKPEAAKADIQKLAELSDKLREAKDNYWSEIVDIQRQVAVAWVLHAEGKYDEALKAMSAAADAEDKTEKHVITPGPLAPARELYGFMLLDRSMPKEAFAAFEATKAKEPNRLQGYAGAAKAADTLGDKAAARQNYQQLVALTANADTERPAIAEAKKYLSN